MTRKFKWQEWQNVWLSIVTTSLFITRGIHLLQHPDYKPPLKPTYHSFTTGLDLILAADDQDTAQEWRDLKCVVVIAVRYFGGDIVLLAMKEKRRAQGEGENKEGLGRGKVESCYYNLPAYLLSY
jgi:hypothetical protein